MAEDPDEVCVDAGNMSVILVNQPPSSQQLVSPGVEAAAQALVQSGINEIPGICVVGTLPGVNLQAVGNDLISRGATQESVQESLGAVCYAGTLSYSAPAPSGVGAPTLPGGTTPATAVSGSE
jgi:hypothetical protein